MSITHILLAEDGIPGSSLEQNSFFMIKNEFCVEKYKRGITDFFTGGA